MANHRERIPHIKHMYEYYSKTTKIGSNKSITTEMHFSNFESLLHTYVYLLNIRTCFNYTYTQLTIWSTRNILSSLHDIFQCSLTKVHFSQSYWDFDDSWCGDWLATLHYSTVRVQYGIQNECNDLVLPRCSTSDHHGITASIFLSQNERNATQLSSTQLGVRVRV